jgi:epoxyqueuosine reductase
MGRSAWPGQDERVPASATLVDEVCRLGREAGLDAVGVAGAEAFTSTRDDLEARKAVGLHGGMHFTYGRPERSTDPDRALPGARALVVGARSYRQAAPAPASTASATARVARYAQADHYAVLRTGLDVVAGHLRDQGWRTRVLVDDNALVDREAAHRAGIGWYGKSSNLLLPGQGSWFVLGSVVTDAPLPPTSQGPVPDGCGPCTRCMTGCPTGAIVAPGVVDARRCLAWLLQAEGPFPLEFREALGDRIYGCDDCQEVCPPNRRADGSATRGPDGDGTVAVLEMLALGDEELMARFGRWYIARRDPRYLRRNALVVLGNTGDGRDPEVVATLRRYLDGDDELLREHAAWAADRLGV